MIYINQDGSAGYEECDAGSSAAFEGQNSIGGFLDNQFVICGGTNSINCTIIDQTGSKTFPMSVNGRRSASSIRLNASTIWITGGTNNDYFFLKSTELVTVNGSTPAIKMPFGIAGHCMIKYKTNEILSIGGDHSRDQENELYIYQKVNQSQPIN